MEHLNAVILAGGSGTRLWPLSTPSLPKQFLPLPKNAPLALRLVYETIDGIWYAAGDSATDFSFYTKRATLAGIYAATLLYWLEDRSPGFADTRAFLDRRLAEVARIGQARHRLQTGLDRLPNPLRLLRPTH